MAFESFWFIFVIFMRHGRAGKTLNMPSDHRRAVMVNLAISLFKSSKVKTTLAKAKVVARYVEKLITRAKVKSIANTRFLASKLNSDCVDSVYEVAEKFSDRKGGYTRVVKTWRRYGDSAETAIIEFVL